MKHALELKNLSFRYPDYPGLKSIVLFKNLNLTLKSGDFRVILGKPESGKTTLFRILLGLVPRYSGGNLGGTILVNGKDMSGLNPFDLIKDIGCIFQNPDEQIITTRCDSEAVFPMESLGFDREEMKKRIINAFDLAGIPNFENRNPGTLSGGEKKRLLIASLYAMDTDLWILDETFDELDSGFRKTFIRKIFSRKKSVILMASKIPADLKGERVLYSVISDGQLFHKENTPEEVYYGMLRKEDLLPVDLNMFHKEPHRIDRSEKPLLEVRNLRYSYPGDSNFELDIESFSIFKGETVSLLGKNGSGKSTFGKILCGLLKPSSGNIFISMNGDVKDVQDSVLNKFTGFLFQNPDYQIFLPSVKEEISFKKHISNNKIEETILLFSLPDGNTPPSIMSYGARKRLQGAVYHLLEKEIYIVDEADSGLTTEDFKTIVTLLGKNNSTIIIITHNLEISRLYSDRIFLMDKGKIIKEPDMEHGDS